MNLDFAAILTDLIILASVIFFVRLLLVLRQIMSVRMMGKYYRCSVAEHNTLLEIIADLLPPIETTLQQAGCTRIGTFQSQHILYLFDETNHFVVYQTPENEDITTFISIGNPIHTNSPNRLSITLHSFVAEGADCVKSYITGLNNEIGFFSTENIKTQSVFDEDILMALDAHKAFVAADNPQIIQTQFTSDALAEQLERVNWQHADELIEANVLTPVHESGQNSDNGKVGVGRFGFLGALRYLRYQLFSLPKQYKTPQTHVPVSMSRQLWFDRLVTHTFSRYEPPKSVQFWQLVITLILSLVIGAVVFGVDFAIAIAVIIIVHEYGHYAMMKHYGYQQTHMLLLPLFGGVAMGREAESNSNHRLWILLLGPLPGILVGILLIMAIRNGMFDGLSDTVSDFMILFTMLCLFINLFNLIPFGPLDGSQILNLLLPAKHAKRKGYVLTGLALFGLACTVYLGWYIITFLIMLTFPRTKHLIEQQKQLAMLPDNANIKDVLTLLQAEYGDPQHLTQRIAFANQLLSQQQHQPLTRRNQVIAALSLCLVPIALIITLSIGFERVILYLFD